MVQQPASLRTSWLRVEGPSDQTACAWCRSWVGRLLPQEMRGEYERNHRSTQACRCRLVPEELRPDPESPDLEWA